MKKQKFLKILILFVFLIILSSCQKEYKISYNLNGGTTSETLVDTFLSKDTITLPNLTKEGYQFVGWYDSSDFSGSPITTINGTINKDIVLYAKFAINTYQITYNLDGGSFNCLYPTTFVENEIVKLIEPNKEGYQFIGWYTSLNRDDETKIDEINNANYDITLYAKWEKEYSINYHLNGGKFLESVENSFICSDTIILNNPDKEGYRFLGWYDLNENLVTTIEGNIKKDIDIYAKWEKVYTISFILDDGILEIENNVKITGKEDYLLPIPSKEGYRFIGWIINGDVELNYLTIIEKGLNYDLELLAIWKKTYNITYNVNEGIMPNEYISEYVSGESELLPIPTKKGYDFLGWSIKGISGRYNSIPVSFEEDIELNAIWSKSIYSITYVLNDSDIYFDKDHLFRSFFGDFYNYIVEVKEENSYLLANGISNLEEFLAYCGNYTGGAAGMSQVGNLLGRYYLKQQIVKDTVSNLPKNPKDDPELYISIIKSQLVNQTADDGFIGYCLENDMYIEFIDFLVEFFFWWRIDESYTGSSSDQENIGSDFFASPWASIVDTAKFFYYDKDTLPSYFTKDEHTPYMYDKIPNVLKGNIEIDYEYDWETGLILPTDLEVEGYTFMGWYLDSECLTQTITYIEKNIYNNIIIYGKFVKNE